MLSDRIVEHDESPQVLSERIVGHEDKYPGNTSNAIREDSKV